MEDYPLFVELHTDQTGHTEFCFVTLAIDPKVREITEENRQHFVDMLSTSKVPVFCWDARPLLKFGMSRDADFVDMKSALEWDESLLRYAKQNQNAFVERLEHSSARMNAHRKAIVKAKIDLALNAIADCIPSDVRNTYYRDRLRVLDAIFGKLVFEQKSPIFEDWKKLHRKTYLDLVEIDENGIKIDVEHAKSQIKRIDLPKHELKFFEGTRDQQKNGFIYTKTSPTGSKTHRFRTIGGFQAMAIPKGNCRKAIVSRFEGGLITSIDFNAIDYRCIVSQIPDLKKEFKDYADFHLRTMMVFDEPVERSIVKNLTYSHVYGGSVETVARTAGLSLEKTKELLKTLDTFFEPITEFRNKLTEKARADGFLITPGGFKVLVEQDDHPGKIIGLYAQTHSSMVFRKALHTLLKSLKDSKMKSKVIFTVHDEIVLDVHPHEAGFLGTLQQDIELVTGFVTKLKKGKNYAEATE